MRTGLNIGIFPLAFLENYKKLDLSDTDVLNVLAFLNLDSDDDKAAKLRGYSNTQRMLTSMQHMLDKGLIIQTSSGFDFTPLFAACEDPKPQTGTIELKPKKVNKNPEHFRAYDEIQQMVFGNKFLWGAFFKKMVENGYTLDDVVGCVKYVNGYYRALAAKNVHGIVRTVNTDTISANIDNWIANGRKLEYTDQEKTVDTDEVMRLVNES